ncbi:MAG: HPF/RaiA family ribosome-associated protein [Roseinatronobacter sp.]|jgi:hypothetical protein|nr:HPF/RaiA family ribosome-associated protein [Roseinatronobacter sp.]
MKIQLNTDGNIEGTEALLAPIELQITDGLSRFMDQISRIELHLSDESSGKSGSTDKRCLLEVRLKGQSPVAVTHNSGTLQEACDGATQKMLRKLDSILGRQDKTKGGHSIRDLCQL